MYWAHVPVLVNATKVIWSDIIMAENSLYIISTDAVSMTEYLEADMASNTACYIVDVSTNYSYALQILMTFDT